MHILPLSLSGLYSIRAQNGYGQRRPCEIVLLALVAPRGVTDIYFSWEIHIEHARTAYHETCGTEYQQPYRRCNSQSPYDKGNIAQARPTSVSDVPRSLQSWVSTTHRSYSQLTFFNIFIKNIEKDGFKNINHSALFWAVPAHSPHNSVPSLAPLFSCQAHPVPNAADHAIHERIHSEGDNTIKKSPILIPN